MDARQHGAPASAGRCSTNFCQSQQIHFDECITSRKHAVAVACAVSAQNISARNENPLRTADAIAWGDSPLRHMYAPFISMFLKHLECSACGLQHEPSHLHNVCLECHKPLLAIIDLDAASQTLTRQNLTTREKSLWRYREVLPLPGNSEPISLGEGGTPLLFHRLPTQSPARPDD